MGYSYILKSLLFTLSILFILSAVHGDIEDVVERIITNPDDIKTGVPIDSTYNESSAGYKPLPNGFQSVPGCPKSIHGTPWVYYGIPPKCFLAGQPGPCGNGRTLYMERGNPYGFCYCDCLKKEGIRVDSIDKQEVRFCRMSGNTEYVFIAEKKQCHIVYEQGPCNEGEWIAKDNTTRGKSTVRCEKRKCPEDRVPDEEENSDNCYARFSPYGAASYVSPSVCAEKGQEYSKILQKCVEEFVDFV